MARAGEALTCLTWQPGALTLRHRDPQSRAAHGSLRNVNVFKADTAYDATKTSQLSCINLTSEF